MNRSSKLKLLAIAWPWLLATQAIAHGSSTHEAANSEEIIETAFGRTGNAAAATRKVEVIMSDQLRFEPAQISVRQGETVALIVKNKGNMLHELVLGTQEGLQEHAAMMKKFPHMEHDEPFIAHVPPGKTAHIIWQFDQAGTVHFGCLIPGHYEGGMAGAIAVESIRKETP